MVRTVTIELCDTSGPTDWDMLERMRFRREKEQWGGYTRLPASYKEPSRQVAPEQI
jgi:hypothetical protein